MSEIKHDIASQLIDINNVKKGLKTRIEELGGEVGDSFDTYAPAIDKLPRSGQFPFPWPDGLKLRCMKSTISSNSSVLHLDDTVDMSNVTNLSEMFRDCSTLTQVRFSGSSGQQIPWSNVQSHAYMFTGCTALKWVTFHDSETNQTAFNLLTNNGTSQGDSYIPSSATIRLYPTAVMGDTYSEFKWQNNHWTLQS